MYKKDNKLLYLSLTQLPSRCAMYLVSFETLYLAIQCKVMSCDLLQVKIEPVIL